MASILPFESATSHKSEIRMVCDPSRVDLEEFPAPPDNLVGRVFDARELFWRGRTPVYDLFYEFWRGNFSTPAKRAKTELNAKCGVMALDSSGSYPLKDADLIDVLSEIPDVIYGFAFLVQDQRGQNWVEQVMSRPTESRRRGVGKTLMGALMWEAQERRRLRQVWLDCDPDKPVGTQPISTLRGLYTCFGFEPA